MILKTKLKYIIIFVLMLFGVSQLQAEENNIMTDNNDSKKLETNNINRLALFDDEDWLKLTKMWKNLGKALNTRNMNELGALLVPMAPESKNGYKKHLTNLLNKKLITKEEYNFISQTIQERYYHVYSTVGLATCYMTGGIPEQRQTLNNLDSRYKILEDLYQKGKIPADTYEVSKNKILEDMTLLKDKYYNNDTPVKPEYVELIMELNK